MGIAQMESLSPRCLLATTGTLGAAKYVVTDNDKLIVSVPVASTIKVHEAAKGSGGKPRLTIIDRGSAAEAGRRFTGIKSIEIRGSVGDDVVELTGRMRTVTAYLGNGNDVFRASTRRIGGNIVFGGDGNDQLRGDATRRGTDLSQSMHFYGDEGNDTLLSGAGDDVLIGGDGNDRLKSAGGRDTLEGGNGKDTLDGGSGIDKLNGGASVDRIEYYRNDKLSKNDKRDHLHLLK